jgi:uncharacterized protein (TIGR02594 family)
VCGVASAPGPLGRRELDSEGHASLNETRSFTFTDDEVVVGQRRPRKPRNPSTFTFKLPAGVTRDPIDAPAWIKVACDEEAMHVAEYRGLLDNNPRILEYLATFPSLAKSEYKEKPWILDHGKLARGKKLVGTGFMMSEVDETSWCACFVNWCLIQAKMPRGPGATAISWRKYGTPTSARVGAICVLHHDPSAATQATTHSGNHVAFYVGGPPDEPVLLGGNQSDVVCRKQFPKWKILDYRWPPGAGS